MIYCQGILNYFYINFYFFEWTEWIINFSFYFMVFMHDFYFIFILNISYFDVPVGIEVRVGDHGALQVEPAIPQVDEAVGVLHGGRRAAEHLARAQRLGLRRGHGPALGPQLRGRSLQGRHELHRAHQAQPRRRREVRLQRLDEVETVELDVDEDVEHGDVGGLVHGDEAAVAVVHHQLAAEGARRVVVHAARAVRHVRHDDGLRARELEQHSCHVSRVTLAATRHHLCHVLHHFISQQVSCYFLLNIRYDFKFNHKMK